ncbi:hypothetical protein PoB_003556800 [Plakobranchus ocellatus]|uniref:Secreted protein n=1 Tax=Plakobranchus ocellatus TaxID=259542 RepID=A0AAV4AQG6_9GAST|nr:hypothetical protein PoB_003556800 [Plakobranchus ocellatus]
MIGRLVKLSRLLLHGSPEGLPHCLCRRGHGNAILPPKDIAQEGLASRSRGGSEAISRHSDKTCKAGSSYFPHRRHTAVADQSCLARSDRNNVCLAPAQKNLHCVALLQTL